MCSAGWCYRLGAPDRCRYWYHRATAGARHQWLHQVASANGPAVKPSKEAKGARTPWQDRLKPCLRHWRIGTWTTGLRRWLGDTSSDIDPERRDGDVHRLPGATDTPFTGDAVRSHSSIPNSLCQDSKQYKMTTVRFYAVPDDNCHVRFYGP